MGCVVNFTLIDRPGVLDQIAGQVRRHGWNIISMATVDTDQPGSTLLTMSVQCKRQSNFPITRFERLDGVISAQLCDPAEFTMHQMLVARGSREAFADADLSQGKVLEGDGILTVTWVGSPEEMDRIRDTLRRCKGLKLASTGTVAIRKS